MRSVTSPISAGESLTRSSACLPLGATQVLGQLCRLTIDAASIRRELTQISAQHRMLQQLATSIETQLASTIHAVETMERDAEAIQAVVRVVFDSQQPSLTLPAGDPAPEQSPHVSGSEPDYDFYQRVIQKLSASGDTVVPPAALMVPETDRGPCDSLEQRIHAAMRGTPPLLPPVDERNATISPLESPQAPKETTVRSSDEPQTPSVAVPEFTTSDIETTVSPEEQSPGMVRSYAELVNVETGERTLPPEYFEPLEPPLPSRSPMSVLVITPKESRSPSPLQTSSKEIPYLEAARSLTDARHLSPTRVIVAAPRPGQAAILHEKRHVKTTKTRPRSSPSKVRTATPTMHQHQRVAEKTPELIVGARRIRSATRRSNSIGTSGKTGGKPRSHSGSRSGSKTSRRPTSARKSATNQIVRIPVTPVGQMPDAPEHITVLSSLARSDGPRYASNMRTSRTPGHLYGSGMQEQQSDATGLSDASMSLLTALSAPRSCSVGAMPPLANQSRELLGKLAQKYVDRIGGLSQQSEGEPGSSIDKSSYLKRSARLEDTVQFTHYYLNRANISPYSDMPSFDEIIHAGSSLADSIAFVAGEETGKDLTSISEWMCSVVHSEEFFRFVTRQSIDRDRYAFLPETLHRVNGELLGYIRRERERFKREEAEYAEYRKRRAYKPYERVEARDPPVPPKALTLEQFHTAFRRSLRSTWCPELEREILQYIHVRFEAFLDAERIQAPLLQVPLDASPIFMNHNFYDYSSLFEQPSTDEATLGTKTRNVYFLYALLSLYLVLSDCLPIKFNIYTMNYKTLRGIAKYLRPTDLDPPPAKNGSFLVFWPAWKDLVRGVICMHCRFKDVSRH
ncbi:hypothetical protein GMRT_11061 [Giardia muris]|uniref:Uncharacterized protein n=1 Tax=Giardia muris TaxID=5742 RepID=A0A4Z1SNF0_GIAMU|nr:hypothetical protein GMRT_11061 [Giardia muris]|eukprot:TNJ27150.1 hypothetical protein GMRT_11061 [Giardia muris]